MRLMMGSLFQKPFTRGLQLWDFDE